MFLEYSDVYPLQNYKGFNWNSLAPMLTAMSRIPREDRMLMQVLARPIKDTPQLHASLAFSRFIQQFTRWRYSRTWMRRSHLEETEKLIQDKCRTRLFRTNVRISSFREMPENCSKNDIRKAKLHLTRNIISVASTTQYLSTTDQNRLLFRPISFGSKIRKKIQQRRFDRPFRLSSLEVATFWHPIGLEIGRAHV